MLWCRAESAITGVGDFKELALFKQKTLSSTGHFKQRSRYKPSWRGGKKSPKNKTLYNNNHHRGKNIVIFKFKFIKTFSYVCQSTSKFATKNKIKSQPTLGYQV